MHISDISQFSSHGFPASWIPNKRNMSLNVISYFRVEIEVIEFVTYCLIVFIYLWHFIQSLRLQVYGCLYRNLDKKESFINSYLLDQTSDKELQIWVPYIVLKRTSENFSKILYSRKVSHTVVKWIIQS